MKVSLLFGTFILNFIYVLIITILYFSKRRLENKENTIFQELLVTNIFGIVIQILGELSYIFSLNSAYEIISKLLLIYYIVWVGLFFRYVIEILNVKNRRIQSINRIVIAISLILVVLLESKVFGNESSNIFYNQGIDSKFTCYFTCLYLTVITIITLFKSISNKKIKSSKNLPIYFFVLSIILLGIVQYYFPSISLVAQIETIVCFIMYFTIGNPEIKKIEDLEAANEQSKKANKAKTEFLKTMSHEIRTPLNAINGFGEIILESNDLNQIKDNAKDIVNSSKSLLEIVSEIADISIVEFENIESKSSSYEAKKTFKNLAEIIKPTVKEHKLEFDYYIAEDIPDVLYGNSINIKKVITNLLTYSVKHTKNGSIKYDVSCMNIDNNCKLIITIETNGTGIKNQNIYKALNKHDENSFVETEGLDLIDAKKLLEQMNGKLIVNNTGKEGTKFTIMINQKVNEEQHNNNIEQPNTLDLKDIRILLVDDNNLNIKLANKILEKYNANNIKSLNSGIDTIEEIKNNNNYDLILLDDMMPKMSGTETLRELKKLDDFNTKVVVLTANVIAGEKENYLKEGFDNYLSKPINREELVKVLNKVLKK